MHVSLPLLPIKTAFFKRGHGFILKYRTTPDTEGARAVQVAALTAIAVLVLTPHPCAALLTKSANAWLLALRTEQHAFIKGELTLQPRPLAFRQVLTTAHDPETLREQLQEFPLGPCLLCLAQMLPECLVGVVAEVAP